MPRESVFSGVVSHSRRYDIEHSFSYPVWMVMALMSGEAAASGRVLSRWLRPRAEKYLTREKVEALVGEALDNARDTVWLLTQPSLVGRSFNPVSFYFVMRGDEIRWIIAHITNTPWDESHCYVLPQQGENRWQFNKEFHVSPFMPMELRYDWKFRVGTDHIAIDMKLFDADTKVFRASLKLARRPNGKFAVLKWRGLNPLQNVRTLVRIYYQAALLKFKGARFYDHPHSNSAR